MKNTFSFSKENYVKLMDTVKNADILVLDNLGEEKQSEWVRDDVIGTIIDYRSKNNRFRQICSSIRKSRCSFSKRIGNYRLIL